MSLQSVNLQIAAKRLLDYITADTAAVNTGSMADGILSHRPYLTELVGQLDDALKASMAVKS